MLLVVIEVLVVNLVLVKVVAVAICCFHISLRFDFSEEFTEAAGCYKIFLLATMRMIDIHLVSNSLAKYRKLGLGKQS